VDRTPHGRLLRAQQAGPVRRTLGIEISFPREGRTGETRAQFDGRERRVHIRINERAGHIYLENDGPGLEATTDSSHGGSAGQSTAVRKPFPVAAAGGLAVNDAPCYQKPRSGCRMASDLGQTNWRAGRGDLNAGSAVRLRDA
jgi:hypothetical protein